MKKLFLFTSLLLTLTLQAKNVAYHPLPDSNAIWNMHYVIYGYGGEYDENYSIIISGDTIINSILYHKLMTPFVQSSGKSKVTWIESGYKGAFRQDITSKKVFVVPPDSLSEQLLYDFNMHVGDTVRGYIEQHVSTKDVIDSVDSVLVGISYHKRWKLSSMTPIYFIEGVGSTFGLIEASTGNIVDGPEISISCFSQNGHTLYPDTVTHCEVILSVEPINKKIDQISVYPNPSKGSFIVECDPSIGVKEIKVMDIIGNIIIYEPVENKAIIRINDLQSGVYILSIKDKFNGMITKKLIVE
jgi:hypothetical protein